MYEGDGAMKATFMLDSKVQTFTVVAREGSFSKASSVLYVSSVSVMKQINALEAELECALFERSHAGVTLTPAGEAFFKQVVEIAHACESAIKVTRDVAASKQAVVRVGSSLMRPCSPLVDICMRAGSSFPFRVEIVPFDDSRLSVASLINSLGDTIDCFVGPCNLSKMIAECSVQVLGTMPCCIGVPQGHRLSGRLALDWDDLAGEELMLVHEGESKVIDAIRQDIAKNHPDVEVIDAESYYDLDSFNECVRRGVLMGSLPLWAHVHPSLSLARMDWDYELPYGIMYAKQPTGTMERFVGQISQLV